MVEEGSQMSCSTADVCQTCGDAGFIELLLCCSKCQISKEHRYCLAVVADEDEFIYTCPQCISSDAKQVSHKQPLPNVPPLRTFLRTNKRQVENLKKRQADSSSLSTVVEAEVQRNENDFSSVLQMSTSEPSVNNVVPEIDQPAALVQDQRKTISFAAELESPAKRQRKSDDCLEESDEEPTCIVAKEAQVAIGSPNDVHTQPIIECAEGQQVEQAQVAQADPVERKRSSNDGEEIQAQELQQAQVEQVESVQTNRSSINDEDVEGEQLQQAQVAQVDRVERKRSKVNDEEIEGHESQAAQLAQVDPVKRKRSSVNDEDIEGHELQQSQVAQVEPVKKKRSSIGDEEENEGQELQLQVSPVQCSGIVEIQSPRPVIGSQNYVYAQPIIDPAWRGHFEIGKEQFGRLEAHMSNKACLKVFEAAKLMPEALSVKMIPRREAWPKSFSESSPTDENIALYFFPGIISAVKAFDERTRYIIDRDLAMKVMLDNAELLIFPSTQLPLLFRRFNGKHYLWGVFRGREASDDTKQINNSVSVCSKMEVSQMNTCVESLRTSPVSPLNYSSDLGGT